MFFFIPSIFCIFFVSAAEALSSDERHIVLKMHNAYRSHMAKGKAHNIEGGKMPPAKNMRRLRYDRSLEEMATHWAKKCHTEHSPREKRRGAGENLAMFSDQSMPKKRALILASSGWYAELKKYGIHSSLVLTKREFDKGIGHWSQMGWAKTTKIGCAVARCPAIKWKTYVVCNYYPGGNVINHHVYEAGETCSACRGKKCREGLCQE